MSVRGGGCEGGCEGVKVLTCVCWSEGGRVMEVSPVRMR